MPSLSVTITSIQCYKRTVLLCQETVDLGVAGSERTFSDTVGSVVFRVLQLTNTVPVNTRAAVEVRSPVAPQCWGLRVVLHSILHSNFDHVSPIGDDGGSRKLAVDGEHATW